MELIFLRHAPARDKEKWAAKGRPDSERPLTRAGREVARESARGLRRLLGRAELVAASPWLRAMETAEPAANALGAELIELALLVPGSPPSALAEWLKGRKESRIVLVGHEPHMSEAVSHLLAGKPGPLVALKKGQALLLEAEAPGEGAASLVWSLPPKALRAL